MDAITIQQAIAWGTTAVATIVTATFALTKYSNAGAIRALEDRLKLKDDKLHDYEAQPRRAESCAPDGEHLPTVYLPARGAAEQMSDPVVADLAKKIEDLEQQRDILMSELSGKATASLDPRSELSNLLTQLQSTDEAVREKGIEGLIALKDPSSFPSLVNFLLSHPDEATSGRNPYIGKWFSALIEAGGPSGAEFVVSQIESEQEGWPEAAFSTIQYSLDTPKLIDGAMPSLKSTALRNPSAPSRTKAKLLIQHLDTKKQEYERAEVGQREYEQQIALLERTKEEQTTDRIPSEFIIMSALIDNGLNCIAHDMIRGGHAFQFWRAGILIAEEFAANTNNRDGCLHAIEQLLKAADGISLTSHTLLLFLLSQIKTEQGDIDAERSCLTKARELSETTVQFLLEHKKVFGVQGIMR